MTEIFPSRPDSNPTIYAYRILNVKDSMGRPVSAGVYLYQIQAGEFVQTKKMVLLK